MKTQNENRNYLIHEISKIIKSKNDIEFAYIFGSFALLQKNLLNSSSFNDIDIAIFLSKDKKENVFLLESRIEDELESMFHFQFDVRVINNASLSFQYNVLKSGILILDKNNSIRTDFEGLTLKKYFEYVHLRNEYMREVINAPV